MTAVIEALFILDFWGFKNKISFASENIPDEILKKITDILDTEIPIEEKLVIDYVLSFIKDPHITLDSLIKKKYSGTSVEKVYNDVYEARKNLSIFLSDIDGLVSRAVSIIDRIIEKYIRRVITDYYISEVVRVSTVGSSRAVLSAIEHATNALSSFIVSSPEIYDFSLSSQNITVNHKIREQIVSAILANTIRHTLFVIDEGLYNIFVKHDPPSHFAPNPEILDMTLLDYFYTISSQYFPLDRGTLMIFSAVTGGGKSTFLLNLALNLVVNNPIKVLYVSNELTYRQILERIARILFVYNYYKKQPKSVDENSSENEKKILSQWNDFKKMFIDDFYKSFSLQQFLGYRISDASVFLTQFYKPLTNSILGKLYVWELEYAKYRVSTVTDMIKEYQDMTRDKIDVVVFDYIEPFARELVSNSFNAFAHYQELGHRAGIMQQFAKSNNSLVVTATQERITPKKNKNQKEEKLQTEIGDIAESKKMTFLADYIMSIRILETFKNDKGEYHYSLHLKTLKNRQGPKDFATAVSYLPYFYTIDSASFYGLENKKLRDVVRNATSRIKAY